ncbi:MAG: histidinol dehydrogenase, partial [Pseudoxanthomonas sp.]
MNRLEWSKLDVAAQRATLLRPVQKVAAATRDAVAALLQDVRERGDAALRDITERFDKASLGSFEVSEAEFDAAEAEVEADLKEAMKDALRRIETFHRAGMAQSYSVETAPGVVCERV